MRTHKLRGNSGFSLTLYEKGGHLFVRKMSESRDKNSILVSQYRKQLNFSQAGFKVPEIIRDGYIEENFYFDQIFIRGQNLNEYIRNNEKRVIDDVAERLFDSVSKLHKLDQKIIEPVEFFSHLKAKLTGLPSSDKFKAIMLDKLKSNIYSIAQFTGSPYIHGDLTQENILIQESEIYFIDLYESYTNCSLVDFSKLVFDLRTGWSNRGYDLGVSGMIKTKHFLNIVEKNICTSLRELVNLLAVLDFERVMPYCNHMDQNFLNNRRKFLCAL